MTEEIKSWEDRVLRSKVAKEKDIESLGDLVKEYKIIYYWDYFRRSSLGSGGFGSAAGRKQKESAKKTFIETCKKENLLLHQNSYKRNPQVTVYRLFGLLKK